eukprot:m.314417 g.314417  ORF g.314417 m.314417 type:complete len:70 (+) comp523566_c0_seq1:98-307(+)
MLIPKLKDWCYFDFNIRINKRESSEDWNPVQPHGMQTLTAVLDTLKFRHVGCVPVVSGIIDYVAGKKNK